MSYSAAVSAAVNLRPDRAGPDGPRTAAEQKPETANTGPLDAAGIAAECAWQHAALLDLSTADAKSRLAEYGANVIKAHEEMVSGRGWLRSGRMS